MSVRPATGIELYSAVAQDASAAVISRYSTSFGLASRLLGNRVRCHVRNVYALVRVADEIVDGPALAAGLSPDQARAVLDALETDTLAAIAAGFSANLVVHAFALTARECGIDERLVRPFFASMREDLTTRSHDEASHDTYVYGSAEVVGLMCLQAFVNAASDAPSDPPAHLVHGARRLGAAFQDVNFLRDQAFDAESLGRDYLGSGDRTRVLDRIDADLAVAAVAISDLPADCRRAVTAAHGLFAELSTRLRRAPADAPRVRVPDPVKALIALRAALGFPPRGPRSAAHAPSAAPA